MIGTPDIVQHWNEHEHEMQFYENWTNRERWEAHMQSAHIKGFEQKTEGAIANWELLLLTPATAS